MQCGLRLPQSLVSEAIHYAIALHCNRDTVDCFAGNRLPYQDSKSCTSDALVLAHNCLLVKLQRARPTKSWLHRLSVKN